MLESDGTQVEDGEYFQTLPENTIFIVLRPGENWAPAGEDIVSQGRTYKLYSLQGCVIAYLCCVVTHVHRWSNKHHDRKDIRDSEVICHCVKDFHSGHWSSTILLYFDLDYHLL